MSPDNVAYSITLGNFTGRKSLTCQTLSGHLFFAADSDLSADSIIDRQFA